MGVGLLGSGFSRPLHLSPLKPRFVPAQACVGLCALAFCVCMRSCRAFDVSKSKACLAPPRGVVLTSAHNQKCGIRCAGRHNVHENAKGHHPLCAGAGGASDTRPSHTHPPCHFCLTNASIHSLTHSHRNERGTPRARDSNLCLPRWCTSPFSPRPSLCSALSCACAVQTCSLSLSFRD